MLAACSPPARNAPVTPIPDSGAQTGLREEPLTIRSANGEHAFTVEIAATPEEQERGLMFRRSLAPDRGMIFPYSPPADVSFWMKNTLIPLDMLFVRSDGTIVRIATAKPLDETTIPAGEPVVAVLEIGGGRAASLGIREGDIASWPH
jgi:uncharacterized membrane protein (UPF0127 family)